MVICSLVGAKGISTGKAFFNEEELDFIINYDIKYRMGKDNEDVLQSK